MLGILNGVKSKNSFVEDSRRRIGSCARFRSWSCFGRRFIVGCGWSRTLIGFLQRT
jgi:hypothetical protein